MNRRLFLLIWSLSLVHSTIAHAIVGDGPFITELQIPDAVCAIKIHSFLATFDEKGDVNGATPFSRIDCSGTLVESNKIITAAHCFKTFSDKSRLQIEAKCGDEIRVATAAVSLNSNFVSYERNFDGSTYSRRDTAELIFPKNFTKAPLALATPFEVSNFKQNGPCAIFGFGAMARTNPSEKTNGPLGGWVNYIYPNMTPKIEKIIQTNFVKELLDDPSVLFFGPTRSAESGDSGGPLLCLNSQNKWLLAGVIGSEVTSTTPGKIIRMTIVSTVDSADPMTLLKFQKPVIEHERE